jgi:hypothetical protein
MWWEVHLEVLGLRWVLWVINRRWVTDMDTVFGRIGILGCRIVHCSVVRGVNNRDRTTSRHDRVDRGSWVESGQQTARQSVGSGEMLEGRKKGRCR